MHVLMAATKTGRWYGGVGHGDAVDDPDEEVGREERAEEHDLRRDEEEHAEGLGHDPRAVVRHRRAVMLVVVVVPTGSTWEYVAMPAPPRRSCRRSTCSTGSPSPCCSRSTRSPRSQPELSGSNVETMISSTRSSCTACIAALNGSGCAIWPCASIPSPRSVASARLQPPLGLGMVACRRVALRRDDEEARRPRRRALADLRQQRLADHRLVRDHEHVLLGRPVADSTTRCSNGTEPAARAHLVEDAAAQPARLLLGMRRDEDLVDGRLERRDRVAHAPPRDRPRRRSRRPGSRPRAGGRAPARGGAAPTRGACRRRRRSPAAARSPARRR